MQKTVFSLTLLITIHCFAGRFSYRSEPMNINTLINSVKKYSFDCEKIETFLNQIEPETLYNNAYELFEAAITANRVDLIQLFKRKNLNVNAKNSSDNTPLHFALNSNKAENIIQSLINAGADLCSSNNDGIMPLMQLTKIYNHRSLEKCLEIVSSEKLLSTDNKQNNLLHYAIHNSDPEVIPVLVNKGLDPLAKNNDGRTPLDYGLQYSTSKSATIIKLMNLAYNAANKENTTDENGNTLLHHMLMHRGKIHSHVWNNLEDPKILNYLIDTIKIDVNSRNNVGKTPLHLAAEKAIFKATETLIEKNASCLIQNNNGKIPLQYIECARLARIFCDADWTYYRKQIVKLLKKTAKKQLKSNKG